MRGKNGELRGTEVDSQLRVSVIKLVVLARHRARECDEGIVGPDGSRRERWCRIRCRGRAVAGHRVAWEEPSRYTEPMSRGGCIEVVFCRRRKIGRIRRTSSGTIVRQDDEVGANAAVMRIVTSDQERHVFLAPKDLQSSG